jgi:nicotinamidase-related amidase
MAYGVFKRAAAMVLSLSMGMMVAACAGENVVGSDVPGYNGSGASVSSDHEQLGSVAHNFIAPGMDIEPGVTALVVTNPQVEFLSPEGIGWGLVGSGVVEHNVIDNLVALFSTAQEIEMPIFVSPHHFEQEQAHWYLRKLLPEVSAPESYGTVHSDGLTDFNGATAAWHADLAPFIEAPSTTIAKPHTFYGPESNDLVAKLRDAGIKRVILAGMCANLSLEAHLRELVEQGFEVQVVADATAGVVTTDYDGYAAAMTNFRLIAHKIDSTQGTVEAMQDGFR